jgi:glycogen phosphorylase/synthase
MEKKKALEYGIAAKHSLEKSAAYNTDCFTTNSDYSAIECNYTLQKNIDLITPSGINTQITKQQKLTETQKEETREILAKYLKKFYNNSISKESLFISIIAQTDDEISGVNAFLDSLAIINKQSQEKQIVAFINIPSSTGVRAAKDSNDDCNNKWKKVLTHEIVDCQNNRILNQIENLNLNEENSKIKILYMPSEINANDGIFNINYSSFIQSMNLCVFPSYYQPWSNTVLDCISFNIPMIITKQSGIGDWIIKKNIDIENAIDILDRDNILYSQFVDNFAGKILNFINNYDNNNNKLTDKINKISILAQWDLFYENYIKSYNIALNKSKKNKQQTNNHNKQKMGANLNRNRYNKPQWKGMIVHSKFPEALKDLDKLANNLWWCWNYEAKELFEEIDPKLWDKYRNPIKIIKEISHSRLVELEKNEDFMYRYNWVLKKFEKYIAKKPDTSLSRIGYFSMEYGLDDSLKIFSGGLGILAGDYLKEASDTNTNMVAVGFLYKFGYFKQKLSLDGDQFAIYNPQNPSELPIELVKHADGTPIVIKVGYPGRLVYAQIWKVFVGRITLYLLDTENSHNNDEDKTITHALYGGDNEMRLKQEVLLGIGGIRALEAVGESPEIYHCNEGHAAFINIERLRKLIKHQNFTFQEALEIVRSSCLYTTHTPVPAGHDSFPEELMMTYLGQFPERLQLSWNEFMNLGRMYSDNHGEHFSMSNLASATSQEINGVSRLHGDVSKDMFKDLWQGYTKDESHIGYVTNGVHYGTWTAKAWRELYESKFGDKFLDNQSDNNFWKKINEIPDEDVWEIRQNQREILINHVKQKLHESWIQRYEDPKKLIKVFKSINKDALTIGFARRFATYKRAYLLFSNLEKLDSIVNNPERPVQFLFAGKAHPNDKPGQGLIKEIVRISKLPQFVGKIIFLEDYDMTLAKRLVQGVDIWLNTPTRPLEASGTSGMKAVMNGALNFSVLDGWWCEGYRDQAGWALPEEKTYEDQEFQNKLDAETIYSILEYEILPLFYNRNMDGLPKDWVKYVKNSISYIAPMFTTKRMIDDYKDRFYSKLTKRYELIKKDDFQLAKDLAQWKTKVEGLWDDINIISMNFPENASTNLSLGEKYKGEITIDAKGLSSDEIGIELVITDQKEDGTNHILEVDELVASSTKGTQITFSLELNPRKAGIFNFGLRMFPKHKDIPYRQDFCYVKWL